jgi:hypothetical protein
LISKRPAEQADQFKDIQGLRPQPWDGHAVELARRFLHKLDADARCLGGAKRRLNSDRQCPCPTRAARSYRHPANTRKAVIAPLGLERAALVGIESRLTED